MATKLKFAPSNRMLRNFLKERKKPGENFLPSHGKQLFVFFSSKHEGTALNNLNIGTHDLINQPVRISVSSQSYWGKLSGAKGLPFERQKNCKYC